MSERDELLKHVKQRQAAVTKKISRIKSTTRAKVSGSSFDIRQPAHEVNSYSTETLKVYLYELNTFMDRKNQFVGGGQSGTVPLTREAWQNFQRKASSLAARADRVEKSIGDIPLPPRTPAEVGATQTIAERASMFARRSNADQSFSPYPKYTRDTRSFSSEAKLVEFTNNLNAKDYEEYADEAIASEREHLRKIHKTMGIEEENEKYDDLTDYQFMILWYGTGFARDKFIIYDIWKLRNEGKGKERYHAGVEESSKNESDRLSKWAPTLPKDEQEHNEIRRLQAEKQNKRKRK